MARISLSQAVRDAVEAEKEAERFYTWLAENTSEDKSNSFLIRMASQEREHANAIEEFGRSLVSGELPDKPSDNVEMVETAPQWRFAEGVSYEDALQIALENEVHASNYYDALSDTCEGDAKKFFSKIADDEGQHVAVVQDLVDKA